MSLSYRYSFNCSQKKCYDVSDLLQNIWGRVGFNLDETRLAVNRSLLKWGDGYMSVWLHYSLHDLVWLSSSRKELRSKIKIKRILFTQSSPTISSLHSPSGDVAETIMISPHYVDEEVEALTGHDLFKATGSRNLWLEITEGSSHWIMHKHELHTAIKCRICE